MYKKNNILPDFLYMPISVAAKGVSPTAIFSPAAAIDSDSGWESATKPRNQAQKKKIVITNETLLMLELSCTYALTLFFLKNDFDVYVYLTDGPLLLAPDLASTTVDLLKKATLFDPKKDYELCYKLGFSNDQLAILNLENASRLIQHIRQGELPYGITTQMSSFSLIQGLTDKKIGTDETDEIHTNLLIQKGKLSDSEDGVMHDQELTMLHEFQAQTIELIRENNYFNHRESLYERQWLFDWFNEAWEGADQQPFFLQIFRLCLDDLEYFKSLSAMRKHVFINIPVIDLSHLMMDKESDKNRVIDALKLFFPLFTGLQLVQLPGFLNESDFADSHSIIFYKSTRPFYTKRLAGDPIFTREEAFDSSVIPLQRLSSLDFSWLGRPMPSILYESKAMPANSIKSSDNKGSAIFDMKPIGQALNTARPINVRGAVIAYKLETNATTGQSKLSRFEPDAIKSPLLYEIKLLTLGHLELYKKADPKDEYFEINQRIPNDRQFHRLRSIHPSEKLEGIVSDSIDLLKFHQGSDDFFYVKNKGPDEINLQFILKLSSEHNKSSLDDLGSKKLGCAARSIIEKYVKQPTFQKICDRTSSIPKITGSLDEWTEILYTEAAGACWHRALAVSSMIAKAIGPGHVRIVSVNQNHEMIEAKNDDSEWIPLDVLGGAEAKINYETPSIRPDEARTERPDEARTGIHATIRAMLLKQCVMHKISTQGEYTSKISAHRNILLLSKIAKQDALSILATQVNSSIDTFYIQKSNDIDIGKGALILNDTGPTIDLKGGHF
ncbi:MAG: hypothetical protein NTV32_10340 [Gammaproteobacteria bacterium]|nr:hypothetical protein [Gammaproteobacteria bacterium]